MRALDVCSRELAANFYETFYETVPGSNFADPRSFAFGTAQAGVPALHSRALAILVGFLALWGLRSLRRRRGGDLD